MKPEIRDQTYLAARLQDHGTARQEIAAAMERLHLVFLYGVTASAGLMGGALALRKSGLFIAGLSFVVLLPTLNFWFIEMIVGQIQLIIRNSKYIREIEHRLSILIGKPFCLDPTHTTLIVTGENDDYPLGWETWLYGGETQNADRHIGLHLRFAVGLFVVLSLVSVLIYVYVFPAGSVRHFTRREVLILRFLPVVFEIIKDCYIFGQIKRAVSPLSLVPHFLKPATIRAFAMDLVTPILIRTRAIRATFTISALAAVFAQALLILLATGTRSVIQYFVVIVLATLSTAYARSRRIIDTSPPVPRTWRNSLANTGTATGLAILSSLLKAHHAGAILMTGIVSSLSAGVSDTLSHELGVLYGGTPRSILSFSRQLPGDSGAISAFGTTMGILAAFGVSSIAIFLRLLSYRSWLIASVAAFLGNVIDSLLGATLERRGILGNDGVNASCTASAAIVAIVASLLWGGN